MYTERSISKSQMEVISNRVNVSNFAFTSEMLLFMFQPNNGVLREIERAKRQLGWDSLPRPILSMHIRHGKMSGETEYFDFDLFMKAALRAQEMYGSRIL